MRPLFLNGLGVNNFSALQSTLCCELDLGAKGMEKGGIYIMKESLDLLKTNPIVDQQDCIYSVSLERKDGRPKLKGIPNSLNCHTRRKETVIY